MSSPIRYAFQNAHSNGEKAVETVKIHSFNKYFVASSVCLAHIWQAGVLPARICSLVYLETGGRLEGNIWQWG